MFNVVLSVIPSKALSHLFHCSIFIYLYIKYHIVDLLETLKKVAVTGAIMIFWNYKRFS